MRGKSGGVQGGIEGAVRGHNVDVAFRIGSWAGPTLPHRSLLAVGREIEHRSLLERIRAITDDPAVVGVHIAVGCPSGIDHSVQQQKGGALFILLGGENFRAPAACRAGSREGRLNLNRTTKLFASGSEIKRMQSLKVTAAPIFTHRHDVDCSVRTAMAIDDRRRGNSNFRNHLGTAAIVRRGFVASEYSNMPEFLSPIRVEGINTVVLRDHDKRIPQFLICDFQLLGIKGFSIDSSIDSNDE